MDWGGDGVMKQDFEMQPGKPTCLPQNGAISQGKSSSKHFFQGMRSVSHMFPIYFWLAWRQVCFFCAICVFFSETTDKHLHFKNMCFWWSFVRQKCQKRFRCQQSERILQGGPPASYNPSYPFIRPFTEPHLQLVGAHLVITEHLPLVLWPDIIVVVMARRWCFCFFLTNVVLRGGNLDIWIL